MTRFSVSAVAFDMDGVLVDTEDLNLKSAFEAFAAVGHTLRADDAEHVVGRHPDDYVPVLGRRFGLTEPDRRNLQEIQQKIYVELWRDGARLVEGADTVPVLLRDRGFRLALATSGSRKHVRHCFERFCMDGWFEVVLTKDDVARRKPDPEIYLRCSERLGLDPAGLLVVEDSAHGVRAAKAAGAVCVALRTAHTPAENVAQADAVVTSLAAIPDLLDKAPRLA